MNIPYPAPAPLPCAIPVPGSPQWWTATRQQHNNPVIEQPIDCHSTAELVQELINRITYTNGLDFVPAEARATLVKLLGAS